MFKNLDRWIIPYTINSMKRALFPIKTSGTVHIMFCFVDHYEPDWGGVDDDKQIARVQRWLDEYPKIASNYKDFDGQNPKHSFFYPIELYNKMHLDLLSELCQKGFGEVEIHLHHKDDSEESLKKILQKGKEDLSSHGFLSKKSQSDLLHYAFIHGNWCLNNSRSDRQWCGVNDESRLLAETLCYADFTFPSAPSETQHKKINQLYYTSSNSKSSKTHEEGIVAQVGQRPKEDLLMIQGVLGLNWKDRKKGIFPGIENSDIAGDFPPTQNRVKLWIDHHIHVKGQPNWVFVKVHTHGAPEKNADMLFEHGFNDLYKTLTNEYNDGKKYALHFVTAREVYNIIKAAEAGEKGNPGDYRDYVLQKRF